MKHTIIAMLLTACTLPSVQAQFSLSPEAGINICNEVASGDYDNASQNAVYFFAGLNGQYWFNAQWAAGLGVQYSSKGYATNDEGSLILLDTRYNYLDFLPGVEYKPWPFLGITAGFNIGALLETQYYDGDSWQENTFPGGQVNDVDFGGFLGVKAYWKKLYLKAHFNRSLTPIYEVTLVDENGNTVGDARLFNQNFQVGLGYQFGG
jgi:hypothetical protein